MELNAEGEVILMPPAGGNTGDRNSEINMQLRQWAKREGSGKAFDSSTGFRLPSGAVRSPDAAWVSKAKLAELTDAQMEKFPPFVLSLC